MSYVRWSSDDFKSDVYCYVDMSGGFTTHVADNRIIGKRNTNPYKTKFEKIGLEYDGATFNDETEAAMLVRLLWLKNIGYRVPKEVLYNLEKMVLNL